MANMQELWIFHGVFSMKNGGRIPRTAGKRYQPSHARTLSKSKRRERLQRRCGSMGRDVLQCISTRCGACSNSQPMSFLPHPQFPCPWSHSDSTFYSTAHVVCQTRPSALHVLELHVLCWAVCPLARGAPLLPRIDPPLPRPRHPPGLSLRVEGGGTLLCCLGRKFGLCCSTPAF